MKRFALYTIWLWSILLLALSACVSQTAAPADQWPVFQFPDSLAYSFPYELETPDRSWTLPEKLKEVSGLSLDGNEGLVMVQDEKGRLYKFNYAADSVIGYTKFAKKGDYEAIEQVGDTYYVLTSNGKLFAVQLVADTAQTAVYATGLPADYDLEGMTYHPGSQRLWMLPKAPAIIDQRPTQRFREVLAFDPAAPTSPAKSAFQLDLVEIRAWMLTYPDGLAKPIKKFDPVSSNAFNPSGIAIHPQTGHIYIIASSGKLMVILEPDQKRVVGVKYLPRTPFTQPEGICFDQAGHLYISNEGRDGMGTLLRFSPADS